MSDGPVRADTDQPTVPLKPSWISPMPGRTNRSRLLFGFAASISTSPLNPADGSSALPVARSEPCDSTAARPPIAFTCRSRISRAEGSFFGAGCDACGFAGAGAVWAPSTVAMQSRTIGRARPGWWKCVRMRGSGLLRGGPFSVRARRSAAQLPSAGPRWRGPRDVRHDAEHVVQVDTIARFEVARDGLRPEPRQAYL